MMADSQESNRGVQADFDRIAPLEQGGWSINDHFAAMMLRQLPTHVHAALEVGCGTGTLALMLAQRSNQVLALDLSPESIRIARERAQGATRPVFRGRGRADL